jgi:NAD(P)H-hydrate epimerase
VNGNAGVACEHAVRANKTVTFVAYKPGHFLGDGPDFCGDLELCDIGLNVFGIRRYLLETEDVMSALPQRKRETNKWKAAVAIVAGSAGMLGAARLASSAAARAGAGMVRLAIPGVEKAELPSGEAVAAALPATNWDANVLEMLERVHALVIGPGLGRDIETVACVRRVVEKARVPTVIDADGLFALGSGGELDILNARKAPTVLTPHDGEFAHLAGDAPGADRVASINALSQRTDAIILAKGSTTVVSAPDGDVFFTNTGSPQLATAGTGDVLSGVIGAFLARGVAPAMAAACGAHIHGLAAGHGFKQGLVAGDLPLNIARVLSDE